MRGYRPTQEESAVEWELRLWGRYLRLQHVSDGSSPSNTLAQIMSGRGSKVGHKVLCKDPPAKFWEFNRNVLRLKRDFYEVLVARYAVPCKPDTGEPYRATELASFLHIHPELYLNRLAKARAGYRSLIFAIETPCFVKNLDLMQAVA